MPKVILDVMLDQDRDEATPEELKALLEYLQGRMEVEVISEDSESMVIEVGEENWGEVTLVADGYKCYVERM